MKLCTYSCFVLFALTPIAIVGKNMFHIVNNTPFTITITAHITGTEREISMDPILPPREGTMNIEDYRIDTVTIRIIDEKGNEMIKKRFPTAFDYPSDLEVTAQIVNPEKLLASPESVKPTFNLTATQKRGTGAQRAVDKNIPFGSIFTLEKPERLLVVNNTPYMATLSTITDLRGTNKKTNIIKAYGEETLTYAQSSYPIEGFTINLFAQNTQTPCLTTSVGKLSSKGALGPMGIRPSFFMIVKEADGSITVHEAITTPSLPRQRIDIIKEWISKDYPISSGAYKRTTSACEKP